MVGGDTGVSSGMLIILFHLTYISMSVAYSCLLNSKTHILQIPEIPCKTGHSGAIQGETKE